MVVGQPSLSVVHARSEGKKGQWDGDEVIFFLSSLTRDSMVACDIISLNRSIYSPS